MMNRLIVLAIACACAAGLGPGSSSADRSADRDDARADAKDTQRPAGEALAGGQHWRFSSAHGPVHVWTPPGYRHETAGVVVYVHGYYTDVDEAWAEHGLADQFLASGVNALFIAPEAPQRGTHALRWLDLGHLIREVRDRVGLKRPWGPIVAVGHSGAYRTLIPWLAYRQLEHIVLLDGLYGHEHQFREWLEQVKGRPNRMTLVAIDTLRWSEALARDTGYALTLDRIPDRADAISPAARTSRLVYMRSQYDHMELVTGGAVLPILLHTTGLPAR